MAASRRGSTYSKNAVLEIFGLLWEETDYLHGMSIPQIHERLVRRHEELGDFDYQPPGERTIREQLNWLSDPSNTILNRRVRKVSIAECEREGVTDYTLGWYMAPYLSVSEMRLLADSLMLFRINDDMLDDLGGKIAHISGGKHALPRHLEHIAAYKHCNTDFLHTIEELNRAIEQGRSVGFEYCEYDAQGDMVPRRYHDGTVRHHTIDPYRTVFRNGIHYLIGHLHGTDTLACFVTDRIRNLCVLDHMPMEIGLTQWRQDGMLRPACDMTAESSLELRRLWERRSEGMLPERGMDLDPILYSRQRPYLSTDPVITITMVIAGDVLTDLYEWFDEPRIVSECNDNYFVQVESSEMAVLRWALPHAAGDGVYIVQPASLRDRLRNMGQKIIECYGGDPVR